MACNNQRQIHLMAAAPSCRTEAVHDNKQPQSLIQDAKDPRFQHLRSLQNSRGRSRSGLYLIEGIRHVARAAEECAAIESVFITPSVLSNPFGQKLARKLRQSGVLCVQLAPQLYRDLTLAAEPQGIAAVVRQQWCSLNNMRPANGGLALAIESMDSPGNLGTIVRTAEAAGVTQIIFLGDGADPYEPAAIRSSMGSLFSHQLARSPANEFIHWAKRAGVSLVGSSPAGMLDYKGLRCRWPAILLIGSEKRGLSEQLTDACDFMVRIPMLGRCDSINAAVASGVLLYELFEQRRR
jgi:RNA methyltransferase, TrmH family